MGGALLASVDELIWCLQATESKPTNEPTPPMSAAPSGQVPTSAASGKPTSPTRNLWQDAFDKLDQERQTTLRNMGFDKNKTPGPGEHITRDLVATVNERQEEWQKKRWYFKKDGKKIYPREYTTEIIGWLEAAGNIAIQFAPPQAGLPWDLVKSLMKVSYYMAWQTFDWNLTVH